MQERELYQQRAQECLRLAEKAPFAHRAKLLEVARAWRLLADVAEPAADDKTIH
jgi:hypothetical protein